MAERERFVPRRVGQLTAELAAPGGGLGADADAFRALSRLVSALYHFELHDREQVLIDAWEEADAGDEGAVADVCERLRRVLADANYVEVTRDELVETMARESLLPLRLDVDLDDYDELLVYRRGGHREVVTVRRWRGLRGAERTVTIDDRVVVLTRVKPGEWFDERGIEPADRNLVPGRLSLKQFQLVPRADIEMLLPSAQVRYRPVDTLLVGLPAVASGIAVLATKLLPTLGLMFVLVAAWLGLRDEEPELDQASLVLLFGGLITIGGFVVRQWTKLKNRRVNYLKTLSETLYFRTLADGPGVVHTLLSSAEQQEAIEVLLAFRFLLTAGGGLTVDELDVTVEAWLREHCHQDVDFDAADAVAKLRGLDLVGPGEVLRARPLADALRRLDRRWDGLFRYAGPDPLVPVTDRRPASAGG
jgi:hypothetical protein